MNERIKILLVLSVSVIVISVIAVIAAIRMEKKKKKQIYKRPVYKGKGSDFWFSAYVFFDKFPITRKYLNKIRKRIEILEMSDNWTISRKTMKFAFVSTGTVVVMLGILLMLNMDMYYFMVSVITIIVVHNQIITMLVDNIENKLLIQFEKFLGDIRHHYHEHGMIDEAVYDSINDCPYEMSIHAHKMYEVLASDDPEAELEKYNEIAPNKYFKTFLANCYTVQKFGDKTLDDDSMFLTNLNYLKQEINMEMLRRKKLDYLFNSLAIIALAPIFALRFLEKWGTANLPELKIYFEGSYGFVIEILLFALVILSYKLINVLKREYTFNVTNEGIYKKIFKIDFVRSFVKILKNKDYTKSLRYERLMKIIGINKSVEQFYLQRIGYMLAAFMVCVFIFVNVHSITKNNILYNSEELIRAKEQMYIRAGDPAGKAKAQADIEAEEEIIKMDREIILFFGRRKASFEDIKNAVLDYGTIKDRELSEVAAARIDKKLKKYQNEYFKWWELIICFLVGGICYNIPYWVMVLRKKVLQMSMEDEVMQFHAIILMLMYIDRVSVDDILRWMEQFAVIFKDSISKCLNNFENGDTEALEQLKIDEPFIPFSRIVENLQSASDKIPIARAFDQLKVERGITRKREN